MRSRQNSTYQHIVRGLLIALLLVPISLLAQESVVQDSARTKGFNAIDFIMPQRYTPEGKVFKNENWKDRLYYAVSAGIQGIQANEKGPHSGMGGTFSVGKIFSPTHSLQVSVDYNQNKQYNAVTLFRGGLSLAYLYNLTSEIAGYNPSRYFEVQFLLGAGTQFASTEYDQDYGVRAYGGFQGKLNLSRQLDFYIEPTVGVGSSKLCLQGDGGHSTCLQYGVQAGLRYVLHHKNYNEERDSTNLPYFVFYQSSFGAQHQLEAPDGAGIGPVATLSVGRWIANGWGSRLSGVFSTNTWHKAEYDESITHKNRYNRYERAAYVGLRTEVLYDPVSLFRRYREEDPFRTYLAVGAEIGRLGKYNYSGYINRTYIAFTGGLHFAWHYSREMSLFVEPRYTLADYTLSYQMIQARKKFSDQLVSLNFGLEMMSKPNERRTRNHRNSDNHTHAWFIELGGGPSWSFLMSRDNANIRHKASYKVGVGFSATKCSDLLLEHHLTRLEMDGEGGERDFKDLFITSLEYRLNITNLVSGYRIPTGFQFSRNKQSSKHDDIHFNTLLCLGPSLAVKSGASTLGAECGLRNVFYLDEQLTISLTPKMYVFKSDFFNLQDNTRIVMPFALLVDFAYSF